MVSNTRSDGPPNTDPVFIARVNRDRQIALAYVRKQESKTAAAEISEATGVNLRTVYRAIKREVDWARSTMQAAPTGGPSDTSCEACDSTSVPEAA